jgi:hypothetical protein
MKTRKIILATSALAALATFVGPAPAQADNGCIAGYVPRLASASDTVCVTPNVAARTQQENANAATYRSPNGGAYGSDTCISGYVWREAFDGDSVCVTPDIRQQSWADNAAATSRMAPEAPEQPEVDEDGGGASGGPDVWGADRCAPTGWDEAFGTKDYNTFLCEPQMKPAEEPTG